MSEMIFQRAGNCFIPQRGSLTQLDKLPAGTYTVQVHNNAFHLVLADDMATPGKIYGTTAERAKRIVKSFLARPDVTTGVLLNGLKGTGKTHLSKRVSELLRTQHQIPTLLITEPYAGTAFNQFISDIKQPCLVLIDEAEKVYHSNDDDGGNNNHNNQAGLLPLLDGAYSSHKLFMFVTNEPRIHSSIMDRPGRVLYRWNYERLEDAVVREYANDTLKNKAHAGELMALMRLVEVSSFDVLKGLIWEINEYDECPFQAVKNLNITWKKTRSMNAEVAGCGQYAGQTWSTHVILNAAKLSFRLNLERNPSNEEEKEKFQKVRTDMDAARSKMPYGLITTQPVIPPELMQQYDDTFITSSMKADNLVSYDHEEDVYEFQSSDFFVRLSSIENVEEKMASAMSSLYNRITGTMLPVAQTVLSTKHFGGPTGAEGTTDGDDGAAA